MTEIKIEFCSRCGFRFVTPTRMSVMGYRYWACPLCPTLIIRQVEPKPVDRGFDIEALKAVDRRAREEYEAMEVWG
jgi:DNA-directed RNA polymerase subunit RPC12/RpoP